MCVMRGSGECEGGQVALGEALGEGGEQLWRV